MKRLYEVSARLSKINGSQLILWFSVGYPTSLSLTVHWLTSTHAPLIGRYLYSRVFIGSLSINHHEECIKICPDLFEVIQGESQDTLRIRQQLDNRRGLTDVSQKKQIQIPLFSPTTYVFLLL